MKRIAFCCVFFSLLFQACGPSSGISMQAAPSATSSVAPTAKGQRPAPDEIPLEAGYGTDGGWYQLFFTDPSKPMAEQMTGGVDEPLVDAINAARLSIDGAVYSLSLRNVRQALVRAQRRGVNVRMVMESDNLDDSNPQALKDAGIPLLGDRREGLMHNKFVVIDRSEVWTGSMNWTNNGAYKDRNNLIRIRSSKLAADYEAEFNEMFVDDRFGPDFGVDTPYEHVLVDGTPIDVYFSPDDHVQDALLDLLRNAGSSVDFLAYSFTSDPLGEAIRARANAGVKVRGVMDAGQMQSNMGTEYDRFRAAGLDVRLDREDGLMHHKVIIIDRQIVVLGSYNFTASAEKNNDENLLVIHDAGIAGQFLKEFRRVYSTAEP